MLSYGIGERRIVVIGEGKTSEALIAFFERFPRFGLRVVGHAKKFDEATGRKILSLHGEKEIDEIILANPEASRDEALDLLSFTDTHQMGFRYSADLFAATVGRTIVHTFAGIPVIEVEKTPLDGWGAIYKRVFDIVGSSALIFLTSPIMLVVSIALFIEQPGRVLFSRDTEGKKTHRIGQAGKPFHYFKFRSMVKDAHKFRFDPEFIREHGNLRDGSPLFKLKDDPRVTRVGKVIRKFHLDELPEFSSSSSAACPSSARARTSSRRSPPTSRTTAKFSRSSQESPGPRRSRDARISTSRRRFD